MKRRNVFLFAALMVLLISSMIGGCVTKAESDFTAADVRVIGLYVQKAQPAVEAHAAALEAAGKVHQAEQLRADTRALAQEMELNARARLEKLSAESQMVDAAKTTLKAARVILDVYIASRSPRAEIGAEVDDE